MADGLRLSVMARESIEERRARLAPGAAWLTAQRESRELSVRELGRRLAINAGRILAYEHAQDEPKKDFVVMLAKEYGMTQVEVWRGLRKSLPDEFEDEEQAALYYARRYPEVFRKVLGEVPGEDDPPPGRRQRHAGLKPKDVTRKGDLDTGTAQGRASCI